MIRCFLWINFVFTSILKNQIDGGSLSNNQIHMQTKKHGDRNERNDWKDNSSDSDPKQSWEALFLISNFNYDNSVYNIKKDHKKFARYDK